MRAVGEWFVRRPRWARRAVYAVLLATLVGCVLAVAWGSL